MSTRWVEKLVEQLGVASLSESQVSEMAQYLDAQVEAFRNRPLEAGPYTFMWVDALTIKVQATQAFQRRDREQFLVLRLQLEA